MNEKTNVMRILDQNKIKYNFYTYNVSDNEINGRDVARKINKNENMVFKTLVTVSKKNIFYVFVIPVNKELDLKKAASIANEKSIQMIKSKDLLVNTGYIHGGCSPIGMKKKYKTFIDLSATEFETIIFSAGKIGYQVELTLNDLKKILLFQLASLTLD